MQLCAINHARPYRDAAIEFEIKVAGLNHVGCIITVQLLIGWRRQSWLMALDLCEIFWEKEVFIRNHI